MRNAVLASTIAAAGFLALAPGALSQDMMSHPMRSGDLKWGPAPPVLPKGAQFTVLAGDPSKDGPFIIRLKAPAGYKVPAHHHPTDEMVTVISGTFAIGMGDKLDEAKSDRLMSGDFVNLGKGMNHYASFPEDTVIQISSTGPFKIEYVNPADNPAMTQ